MENENINKGSIRIKDRKETVIDGVKKLDAFDEFEFSVDTNLGHLTIQGTNLALEGMDMEKGILTIAGTVNSLKYGGDAVSRESILKKIFK